MNWWYAQKTDPEDKTQPKELWIGIERWFNARQFAMTKMGDKIEVKALKGGEPPTRARKQGLVFVGRWTKHDSSPNSNLIFDPAT